MNRNPSKNKCFIYHIKGHFPKACPKFRKARKKTQYAKKMMVVQFLTDNKAVYYNEDKIPKSVSNTNKRMFEDVITLLIDVQPHPLQVIASMDTKAATSTLNPKIILGDQCVPQFRTFGTTSREVFLTTRVIARQPIMLEFFLIVLYRIKIIGSNTQGKDLIIRFDIYMKLKNHLLILKLGITFMGQFRQYSIKPSLFQISKEDLVKKIEN